MKYTRHGNNYQTHNMTTISVYLLNEMHRVLEFKACGKVEQLN